MPQTKEEHIQDLKDSSDSDSDSDDDADSIKSGSSRGSSRSERRMSRSERRSERRRIAAGIATTQVFLTYVACRSRCSVLSPVLKMLLLT